MAQWGKPRSFERDGTVARIVPHIDTEDVWRRSGAPVVGIIDGVQLSNVEGEGSVAADLLAEAGQRFCGRPYREWLSNG